jgi:hypothetical protein
MAILNFLLDTVGQVGVAPRFIYLNTNNTVAQVTATGYLNKFVSSGNKVYETDMAVVATKTTPSALTSSVQLFNVTYSAGNWSLTANSTPLVLANGQIFVGNASGVATGVTMSGDATISNTGVLTIANSAVTLAKLAVGVRPSAIVKFNAFYPYNGGSASVVIPVVGCTGVDYGFAVCSRQTNAVSVLTVATGVDTLTVTFSGDPGVNTLITYQVLRDAA